VSLIAADTVVLALAKLYRAQGSKVLGILRDFDQIIRLRAIRDHNLALLPHAGNVGLPRFPHATNKAIGPTQQQNVGTKGVTPCQHAEILQNDGLEQRRHQFVGRSANLLQAVDVGLGKYAALAGDLVQFDPLVSLFAELKGRDLQLGIDLVDDRARSASAL